VRQVGGCRHRPRVVMWVVFALGFSSVEAPFVRDPGEAAVYRAGNGGHGIDAPEHFSCTPDNCRNRCGAEVFGLVLARDMDRGCSCR
jgi:hypothetical protein